RSLPLCGAADLSPRAPARGGGRRRSRRGRRRRAGRARGARDGAPRARAPAGAGAPAGREALGARRDRLRDRPRDLEPRQRREGDAPGAAPHAAPARAARARARRDGGAARPRGRHGAPAHVLRAPARAQDGARARRAGPRSGRAHREPGSRRAGVPDPGRPGAGGAAVGDGPGADRAGAGQPDRQRLRGLAARRRGGGPGHRRAGGAVSRRARSRPGHRPGGPRAAFPSVFHDQATRQRARARGEPQHRPRARRADRRGTGRRRGQRVPRAAARGGGTVRQSVLIVDDEALIRRSLKMALEGAGYAVSLAASGHEALALLADEAPDCALIDLRLGDLDGLAVLREARERLPGLKAIVITAHGDVDSAVTALRLGAFDFIKKPFDLEEVIASVKNALRTDELERQVAWYSGQHAQLVFESEAMREVMRLVEKVAAQPVPVVLVVGETGTGKELIARTLHQASAAARGPFIELNCAAIPEALVESELFGHERGAFSDAREQKRGLVELAAGGTLFLDEVGDLPAAAQAKLLKFLDSREFRRLGGTKLLSVDCRLVAATNRRLEDVTSFRRDLYYRLAGVTIAVPPLRERGDDVLLLARHFLPPSARQYRWPGNVRELKAAISSAAVLADGPLVDVGQLGQVERSALAGFAALPDTVEGIVPIDALEVAYATRVVELCGGNKALAAQRLGISRQTLARWLAEPGGS